MAPWYRFFETNRAVMLLLLLNRNCGRQTRTVVTFLIKSAVKVRNHVFMTSSFQATKLHITTIARISGLGRTFKIVYKYHGWIAEKERERKIDWRVETGEI